jgi:hypothetical protein
LSAARDVHGCWQANMSDAETNHHIDELHNNLTEKLGELHRRAAHAKRVLSPSTYWNNPWIRLGIGAAIGFAIADRRPAAARTHEGLVHAVVRAGLCAAASALVARSLAIPRDDA